MTFAANLHVAARTATIRLTGDLDSAAAAQLNDLVGRATAGAPDRLVLIADELTYLSSAGLRCLVFAHQKMGDGEIMMVGVQPAVAETIRLTGFHRSIQMRDGLEP